MEKCRAEHGLCIIPMRGSDRKLTQLHVIDCISRQVVPAPTSCQFVALSYVWGTSVKPRPLDGAAKLPQTIEDAILVTTASTCGWIPYASRKTTDLISCINFIKWT